MLVGTAKSGEGEPKIKMPIIQMEMGGLCLKTLQSDIFNNWLKTDWIDGENGISKVTALKPDEDGTITMDALNLQQKVYNMLNRIAVSDDTYRDWLDRKSTRLNSSHRSLARMPSSP